MMVPPNHPFIDGFSIINRWIFYYKPSSYWGTPISGNRHISHQGLGTRQWFSEGGHNKASM